jgi:hypothetical protein
MESGVASLAASPWRVVSPLAANGKGDELVIVERLNERSHDAFVSTAARHAQQT